MQRSLSYRPGMLGEGRTAAPTEDRHTSQTGWKGNGNLLTLPCSRSSGGGERGGCGIGGEEPFPAVEHRERQLEPAGVSPENGSADRPQDRMRMRMSGRGRCRCGHRKDLLEPGESSIASESRELFSASLDAFGNSRRRNALSRIGTRYADFGCTRLAVSG
jgi:hypothetical protein